MDWLDALRLALDRRTERTPLIATLATVNGTQPRARSVVVRGLNDDGSAHVASDARSDKNRELRDNPAAELVLWLAQTRQQFRLLGDVELLTAGNTTDIRSAAWRGLSDASRALFFWPPPGEVRSGGDEAFPPLVSGDVPPPASFEVLVLRPRQVEELNLSPHPHLRRRWRRETGWGAEVLNP